MKWSRTLLLALSGSVTADIGDGDQTVPDFMVVGEIQDTHSYIGPTATEIADRILALIDDGTITPEEARRVVVLQKLEMQTEVGFRVDIGAPMESEYDERGDAEGDGP